MTLGEKIHLLRRRLRWTQKQLGERAQMSANTIARLERGEIQDPGGQILLRLARVLETSTDFLLGRSDDPTNGLWPSGMALLECQAIPEGTIPITQTPT